LEISNIIRKFFSTIGETRQKQEKNEKFKQIQMMQNNIQTQISSNLKYYFENFTSFRINHNHVEKSSLEQEQIFIK
jgi:hypothetical protein